jgi:capsular exopolysaccharide synthesis family protein
MMRMADRDLRNASPGGIVVPVPASLLDRGIFGLHPRDPRAKPFILLRTQILNALAGAKGRMLAVTSPSALNGKSYVSANLATAISRVEDVCLVDLHLRRPVMREWFELPQESGLSACLAGERRLRDSHFHMEGERLNIFPAGDACEDSSELLSSNALPELMSQLRSLPGEPVCIVDTPPVLEHDDMMLIAKHVDAFILVVEEGRNSRRDVAETMRLMTGTPLIGTLLNKSIMPSAVPGR